MERGLKRLHLVQVKTTRISNKTGLCTRGDYLQGIRRVTVEFERDLYQLIEVYDT